MWKGSCKKIKLHPYNMEQTIPSKDGRTEDKAFIPPTLTPLQLLFRERAIWTKMSHVFLIEILVIQTTLIDVFLVAETLTLMKMGWGFCFKNAMLCWIFNAVLFQLVLKLALGGELFQLDTTKTGVCDFVIRKNYTLVWIEKKTKYLGKKIVLSKICFVTKINSNNFE